MPENEATVGIDRKYVHRSESVKGRASVANLNGESELRKKNFLTGKRRNKRKKRVQWTRGSWIKNKERQENN